MPKQEACDAPPALSARGEESKLGALRVVSSLRGETPAAQEDLDAVLPRRHHQGRNPLAIDVSKLLELGIGQLLLGTEKAPVDRLSVKLAERFEDLWAVLGTDGANRDLRAVLQLLTGQVVAEIDHGVFSIDDVIAAV